jgi:hypothetical protein
MSIRDLRRGFNYSRDRKTSTVFRDKMILFLLHIFAANNGF